MFRDFKLRNEDRLGKSYLKYVRLTVRDISGNYDISERELNFLLFAYNYEFFTIDHVSEVYFYHKLKLAQRIIYPLQKKEYIYKYYNRLSPNNYEEAIFDESKMRYRVRYSLTQKARMIVQKFYRKLEGEEQINVPT
tara:strand:- start:1430 stop:1840 length:411 start_codon:yes stop_codon:yes gene_type:complete